MELDTLREQVCAALRMLAPQLGDASALVDECLASARRSFSSEFIGGLPPQAWARITLSYHAHFLDTGSDVSVGDIVQAVIRDAIRSNRFDALTQDLAVRRRHEAGRGRKAAGLSLVKR